MGPKSSPFRAKPKINFNVKTASFGSIQGLPMAASKTSVLLPSKLSKGQRPLGDIFGKQVVNKKTGK